MALTALKVKNAKPGRHVDGRGLCLLVKPSGARTWVLRMQKDGRRRDYGLGSALDVSLAEARDAASALRRRVREGVDPVQLNITIAAVGYYYLTNRFTGSIVFERDLMAKDALDERLRFNIDTIMRLVAV